MSLQPDEVRVAGAGRVLVAPPGTAGPSDVLTNWPSAWADLGYTSDDGVKLSRKVERDGINVWQSLNPIRYVLTKVELTAEFTLMQWNEDTLRLYWGGGAVTGTTTKRFAVPAIPDPDPRALGIEINDGPVTYRFVIPRGEVSDTADLEMKRANPSGLGVTFGALGGQGSELAYWLWAGPAAAGAASIFATTDTTRASRTDEAAATPPARKAA